MQTIDRDAMIEGLAKAWQLSGGRILIPLAQSAVAISCPADANEDILATFNLAAGLLGPNGILRLSTTWSFTNNANTKTPRIRFSEGAGTVIATTSMTTALSLKMIATMANRGVQNSQITDALISAGGGVVGQTLTSSAIDTTAATSIVISGQKAVGGDTFTLESYLLELIQGA